MNNRRFNVIYLFIVFFSKIGNGFFFFLITWIIADVLKNPFSTPYNLVASIIPSILLSHFIGSICDKRRTIHFCIGADFVRSLLVLTFFVFISLNKLNVYSSFFLCLIFYVMSETQQISWRATISKNFHNDDLLNLNTSSVVGGQAGVVIGAASAGFLAHYINYEFVIFTTSLLYFISSLLALISGFYLSESKMYVFENISHKETDAQKIRPHFLYNNKLSICIYAIMLVNVTVLYSINSTLSPFVNVHLKLNSIAFSFIDASYSVGAICGGYMISYFFKKHKGKDAILMCFAIMSLSLFAYGNSSGLIVPSLCYFFIGVSSQSSIILLTQAQKATSRQYQARVYSIFNTATGFIGLITYAVSYLVIYYSTYTVFFITLAIIPLFFLLISNLYLPYIFHSKSRS